LSENNYILKIIYDSKIVNRRIKELNFFEVYKSLRRSCSFLNAWTECSRQETDSTCNRGENTFSGNALSGGFAIPAT